MVKQNSKNNQGSSTALNLESLNVEYKNLLIEYKQAVSNYVNYLKQEVVQPCASYNANSKGISQACYNDIWKKAGCGTGNIGYPSASASWQKSQTMNGLIQDSWYWATWTDYTRRMGCYGQPGNPYIIIGVGTDGNIYSRQGLDAPWQKVNDNSNGNIATVFTGNDGKLYGTINKNNNTIVYKNKWSDSVWSRSISGSCCVLGAAMGQDGTIVGVGTDYTLYSKPNLNAPWVQTASKGEKSSAIAIASDGSLFVVGGGNVVYKKNSHKNLPSQNWTNQGSCCVKSITIAPDGTFIGVGTDNQLYTKQNYKDLTTAWKGPYSSQNSSCCVTSITTVANTNYNTTKYNTSTAPDFNIVKPDMTSLKDSAFWGTSPLSQSKVNTVGECQALCANASGCSGATYNQTTSLCSLRKGDANIVAGGPTDYSIVPKAKSLLKIVQGINDKLTQVNQQIQTLSQTAEKEFNTEAGNRTTSNTNLLNQYSNLVVERTKIKNMLDEYQTLDEKQNEGDIQISQNYYSFILLMILAILFIFLLYKFYSPSAESTTTFVQNGGELGTSAYYMIFGFFVLILLLTCYNKYKLL